MKSILQKYVTDIIQQCHTNKQYQLYHTVL